MAANGKSGATDPLLAALIGKLPETAKPWARADRIAWLEMMAKAFDVVYGREDAIEDYSWARLVPRGVREVRPDEVNSMQPRGSPIADGKRQAHAGYEFYIGVDGTAHRANGAPVLIADIPPDEAIFDYRPVTGEFRDRDGITWADGQRGVAGLAPGCSFAGPG